MVNIDQACRQSHQSSTSVTHETIVQNILDNLLNPQSEHQEDEKARIKDIIIEEIKGRKCNLHQIKTCIEEEFHTSLSSIDRAYIEGKYLKYCCQLWLQEATDLLKTTSNCNNHTLIQKILSTVHTIKTLSDIPESFKQLEYYKLLVDHIHLVSENSEKVLIKRFKKECLEQIVTYSATSQKESIFLEAFIDFLSSFRRLQSVIDELKLLEFCRGEIFLNDLIDNVMNYEGDSNDEKLTVLQEACRSITLIDEINFIFVDKFKNVISGYLKPIEIQEKSIDNRQVLEVIGNNINITEILTQLENTLSEKPCIEEVRFIVADVVHIDTNLDSLVWKGRNLVILTTVLKVYNKVLCDISGKNNTSTYKNDAGTACDGVGNDGKDGYPGESGGNVLILVNEIINPENLTIISNGGNGSDGQDGGDGIDGIDGKGITNSKFRENFPPVSKFFSASRRLNILTTIRNIENDLQDIKTEWCRNYIFCEPCTTDVIKEIKSAIIAEADVFLHTTTEHGNEIIFSYQAPNIIYNCQSFLLYKGSLGKPGYPGGQNGLGGRGGYPGDILVCNVANSQQFNIIKKSIEGTAGKNGKPGKYGNHGKNGWDMGYMDYSVGENWPQFFGTDHDSKLTIKYYKNESSERVHCPYKINSYDRSYAQITYSEIEHKKDKKYEERQNSTKNRNRQHHAHAVRKKNISQNNILANYSLHGSCIDKKALQNLRSELDNTKQQARKAIGETEEGQTKQMTELGVKRNWNFIEQKIYGKQKDIKRIITFKETDPRHIKDFLNKLKYGRKLNLDQWFQLQNIEVNHDKLNNLFSVFKIQKKKILKYGNKRCDIQNKLKEMELLLVNKYRFATLKEIAKQLLSERKVKCNIKLAPETAAKYLIKEIKKRDDVSHFILGTLHQYLYEDNEEQRKKVADYCKRYLQRSEEGNQSLKHSLKIFILEIGNSETGYVRSKKYFTQYMKFLKDREYKLKIFSDAFNGELSKLRHKSVFDLWNQSTGDTSLKQKLENEIKNDNFLNTLYIRLKNQLSLQYDWEKCCKERHVLKEYYYYIRENGSMSKSYRELLANEFNVNIRLYIYDENYELTLRENNNSKSRTAIHIVQTENKLTQFRIDENYLRLDEERVNRDILFNQILTKLHPFNQKQDFDIYLNNKIFLKENLLLKDEQYFDSEGNEIEKIMEYFSNQDEQHLATWLEKITPQYIGNQKILHYILKRLSTEGRNISCEELSYIIDAILASVIQDKKEMNTFCWIIAAYSQQNWIDEIILLQLEDYFRSPLEHENNWREYLSKIKNKYMVLLFGLKLGDRSKISIECVENILYMLSNISTHTLCLEGLELFDWQYILKEKYWLSKLQRLANWQESETLPLSSYYLLSLENTFGTKLTTKLLDILENRKQELTFKEVHNILSNFHSEKWRLGEDELKMLQNRSISEWTQILQSKFRSNEKERDLSELMELIKDNANTSEEIVSALKKIADMTVCIFNENCTFERKNVNDFTKKDIKIWKADNQDFKNLETVLSVINRAIELNRGFKLRITQILTVLAFLTNDHSTLAQVSTGEGKSLIVVALSLVKALRGEKVDIVTSSSILAKRDAEANKDIFNLFGFNVSHNCSEDIEKRKEVYSNNQVVYGDLSNFQRDYLLDRFYGKNILGDHDFENIIVDEVDSMLLDKGNNMLYLTHNIADLDKLSSVYLFIWRWIKRPVITSEDVMLTFDAKAIKEAVLNELYRFVKKEDIGKLGSDLSAQHKTIIWERLVDFNILDNQGKLLKETIDQRQLNEILSPEFVTYKDRLNCLLMQCKKKNNFIRVPNHLKSFVERHLDSWINSAITAFFMKAEQDYVVDVDRSGMSADRNPIITIIDKDTGTDEVNSQWDEALHQFLQLKHGCKLTLQSLKAVFISNISFFKLYRNLYGLTGSLGSQREKDLLRQIHRIDFVTIPTAKPKQLHEDIPILCSNKNEWINSIYREVSKVTKENNRSVLIISETVHNVEVLYKAFGGGRAKHVHKYVRDYEEFDIAKGKKELKQGQIIIATNLAGRGTDIKITKELRKAGGLHVCLTYLPRNLRIEQQAFGRAARCGDKGSGQLIILDLHGKENCISKILDLKKQRDVEEICRISNIKTYYDTQIYEEEKCFSDFKEQYERLNKDLDGQSVPSEIKDILLKSVLDNWAFWLDENGQHIKLVSDEQQKRNFKKLLDEFINKLRILTSECRKTWIFFNEYNSNSWLNWVNNNPVQMIKLGRYLSQNKAHKNSIENAIQLFDEVIRMEPHFSEAAHYYKAFALAKHKKASSEVLDVELRMATKLIEEHCRCAMIGSGIADEIKDNNNKSILQIEAYKKQQENIVNLYNIFSQSIDNIFGHIITPQSFTNDDINEELSMKVYNDLLKNKVLNKPKVKQNICEEDLETVCFKNGISIKLLKDFLSKYKDINESTFLKDLKREIKLPNKEEFWKLLIEKGVLTEDVHFIIVNNKKLKKIDPSLLDFLYSQKELEKQTLKVSNEYLLMNILNTFNTPQKQDDCFVFKKKEFVKSVGKEKYKALKERGVFSFNRQSRLNVINSKSINFCSYDTITLEDFNKININKNEAEKILRELVERKIIEESRKNAYRLKIKYHEFEQIELRPFPVYENDVRRLLSVCFSYRIVLQKLEEQIGKDVPICLQLLSKPHLSLFFELMEENLIKYTEPIRNDGLEKKLKQIYKGGMSKEDFILIISEEKLIPQQCIENLFNQLVENKWVYYDTRRNNSRRYYINSSDKRQKPLNFSTLISCNIHNIDETVEKILDNQIYLTKIETIKYISSTLERSQGSLQSLKVPEYKLTSLSELETIEEIQLFSLNALDQLLQLEEKKWTLEMIYSTATVFGIGICETAAGYWTQLYTVGLMTNIGSAIIDEGINDLLFAIDALKSGYFTWKQYGQYKLKNLLYSAINIGAKFGISRLSKLSQSGSKPNLKIDEIIETSEKELIKAVDTNLVVKKIAIQTASETINTVRQSITNMALDVFVDNCLRKLCEEMANMILSSIEQEIEQFNITANLESLYHLLGEREAIKILNGITNTVFTNQSNWDDIACDITKIVTHNIKESVSKIIFTNLSDPDILIPVLTKITYLIKATDHIIKIRKMTKEVLIGLDQKIKDELHKQETKVEQRPERQTLEAREDYEYFKTEVVDQWKTMIRKNAGQIIEQHFVRPLLEFGAKHLITHIRKSMKRTYISYKETGYRKYFDELKQTYVENVKNTQETDNRKEIKEEITEKYHKDLLKLLTKTRNPDLYADMVNEGIPMNMAFVDASAQIIKAMLKNKGYETNIQIIVIGNEGIKQEFSTKSGKEDYITILLQLKDNHFNISKSRTPENDTESKNNSLYEALSEQFPPLKNEMSPEQFRIEITNCIRTDKDIRNFIKKSGHQLPSSSKPIRNASKKSKLEYEELPYVSNQDVYDFTRYHYMRKEDNVNSQRQNNIKWSHEWHGESEATSRNEFQSRNLKKLVYPKSFTAEDAMTLKAIRKDYKAIIKNENISDKDLKLLNRISNNKPVEIYFKKDRKESKEKKRKKKKQKTKTLPH